MIEFMNALLRMSNENPNDADLGEKIRSFLNKKKITGFTHDGDELGTELNEFATKRN